MSEEKYIASLDGRVGRAEFNAIPDAMSAGEYAEEQGFEDWMAVTEAAAKDCLDELEDQLCPGQRSEHQTLRSVVAGIAAGELQVSGVGGNVTLMDGNGALVEDLGAFEELAAYEETVHE